MYRFMHKGSVLLADGKSTWVSLMTVSEGGMVHEGRTVSKGGAGGDSVGHLAGRPLNSNEKEAPYTPREPLLKTGLICHNNYNSSDYGTL